MASAGAIAGAAVIAAPGAAGAADDHQLPADAPGAMVAYVKDVHKGELLVMVDGHEVVVTDKALVARLAKAFARAARG